MKKTDLSSILVAMLELHLAGTAHARQPGRIARLGYVSTSPHLGPYRTESPTVKEVAKTVARELMNNVFGKRQF